MYATRFERLVQSLGLVNVKNDDAVLQATFKAGLVGSEFLFVQTLLTMTTYATFELMKIAVISYSKSPAAQELRAQALQQVANTQNTGEVNVTERGPKKRRQMPPNYSGCHNCKSKKHRVRDCPHPVQKGEEQESSEEDNPPPKKKKRMPILSLLRDKKKD